MSDFKIRTTELSDTSHPLLIAGTQWLEGQFQISNKQFFDNALPMPARGFHVGSPLGQFFDNATHTRVFLTLTKDLLKPEYPYSLQHNPRFATDILLHEMIHLALFMRFGCAMMEAANGHGAAWIRTCKAFAPRIGLNMDFETVAPEMWAYFPHVFTEPAFYLGKQDNRRVAGDNTTLYKHRPRVIQQTINVRRSKTEDSIILYTKAPK